MMYRQIKCITSRLFALCAVLLLLMLTVGTNASADVTSSECIGPVKQTKFNPFKLYGNEINFRVDRNGSPVGFHRVEFKKSSNGLIVKSLFEIKISFLFFTAYSYTYRSESLWQGDCLISLTASTNDDGDKSIVQAQFQEGQLQLRGPSGKTVTEPGLYPTNHWHSGILAQDRILNTITGYVNRIQIKNKGPAIILINGAKAQANHYVYSGDLNNELWYDRAGRWVKMRFLGNDGSTIEYFCQRCRKDN